MALYGVLWLAVSVLYRVQILLVFRPGQGLKGFIFALLLLRDTLLSFRRCRGCKWLLMRSGVSLVSLRPGLRPS